MHVGTPSGILEQWYGTPSGILEQWFGTPSGILVQWYGKPSGILVQWYAPSGILVQWYGTPRDAKKHVFFKPCFLCKKKSVFYRKKQFLNVFFVFFNYRKIFN